MPALRTTRRHSLWALLLLLPLAWSALPCRAQPHPAVQSAAQSSVYDLDQDREPLVSLDGPWRFHPGDDPGRGISWADPAFDDSAWPLLRSDASWSTQGYPGMSGFGWYRFTVVVPAKHQPLALELAPIMTSYRIYIDGRLAGEVGSPPHSNFPIAVWTYQVFPLPAADPEAPSRSQTIHIAIRVWHSHIWSSYMGGGPMTGGHLLGASKLLADELRHHDGRRRLLFVDMFSYSIAALIIAITIFGLYVFRPQEREYLWFALLLLAKALDAALTISKQVYAFPAIPVFDLLDGTLVACAQAALLLFLSRVLRLRHSLLWRALMAMVLLSSVCGVLYWPNWLSVPVAALLQILLLLPSSIWILAILLTGAIRRNGAARLLLLPILLIQGFWIADNVVVALNQFGFPIEAYFLDNPIVVAPYTMHPAVLAELLFLLGMLAFVIRRFTIARRREERFDGELEAARQVQQILLPEEIAQVPGFAVDCIYHPAERVGGDFFQILPAAGGGLLVVVGDVAGKGLPAALMVSVLVGAIRAEAAHTSSPAMLLAALNRQMFGQSQGKFTTCLCLYLASTGEVQTASAGHLAPYRDGVEMPSEPALPLGILPQASYDTSTFTLTPGERITIVSDGVLEAQSHDGELLGFDRTRQMSTLPAAQIAAAARDFGQNDDITVVTIKFHGDASARQSEPAVQVQVP